MRLLVCFLVATIGALAQAPVFTNVGPLSCGIRLYQPGQVQEYCYFVNPPAPLTIICNALHAITPSSPGSGLPVAASQSCFATDAPGGNVYEVTWIVWPNASGIQFQIASSKQPCTVNDQGACVGTTGTTATTTTQTGTFSGGLAHVETVTVEGEAAQNNEYTPDLFPYWFWRQK